MKDKECRKEISRRLREAILQSGLTYKQIGDRAGLHINAMSGYMKADPVMPSAETLAALCRVLHVSADQVLGLEDKNDD